jgi:hypothetical protein
VAITAVKSIKRLVDRLKGPFFDRRILVYLNHAFHKNGQSKRFLKSDGIDFTKFIKA